MAERDWGAIADRLERWGIADNGELASMLEESSPLDDEQAAAEGLRLLADLTAAIGDPDNLRLLAAAFDLPILARIAAAVPQDPERCACGKPATGTVGGVPTCGDDR